MARKSWVGGNWKSNGTVESVKELCCELNKGEFDASKTEVVVFPATLHVPLAQSLLDNKKYAVGAQNVSSTGYGAYTGEVPANMLKNFNISNTLIGHSERRTLYGETNDVVATKVGVAQSQDGLVTILCIGEKLDEREAGKTNEILSAQLEAVFPKISDWNRIVIAYEPVWAIGTGKVATKEQAQEAHEFIRGLVAKSVNQSVADSVRIVYGGSVNEKNCGDIALQKDIDGFLVGGASLKPTFVDIIKSL